MKGAISFFMITLMLLVTISGALAQDIPYTGEINKQNPERFGSITHFLTSFFTGQPLAFDKPVTDISKGSVCSSTGKTEVRTVSRGGIDPQSFQKVDLGSRCSVGEHIRVTAKVPTTSSGAKRSQDVFSQLWRKNSNSDNIRLADYRWTRQGIFDNYNLKRTEFRYECFQCNQNIVLGCTDQNANNYDKNANRNDGSCKYDSCVEKSGYVVENGNRKDSVCISNSVNAFTCSNNKAKLTITRCASDEVCQNAKCEPAPVVTPAPEQPQKPQEPAVPVGETEEKAISSTMLRNIGIVFVLAGGVASFFVPVVGLPVMAVGFVIGIFGALGI